MRWWPAPPDDWDVIVLTIERAVGSTAIGELSDSISSPAHSRPPTMPDDSLYEATYRLDELIQRHEGMFRRDVYRVELSADSWKYTAKFEYDERATG